MVVLLKECIAPVLRRETGVKIDDLNRRRLFSSFKTLALCILQATVRPDSNRIGHGQES